MHDGVIGLGRKVRIPGRRRHKADKPVPQRRASSEPRGDRSQNSRRNSRPDDFSDDEDQGYISEDPRRRSRRYSNTRENEPTNGDAPYRRPYPNELPKDSNREYPPPPYRSEPTAQYPYAMPPPSQRDKYGPSYPYQGQAAPPPVIPPPPPFPPENRRTGRSERRNSSPPRRIRHERKSSDHSFGASIAGALAGGLLGHQAGKGDMFATAAGAIAGAFGGGIVAEKRASERLKRDQRDRDWDRKYGENRR